MRLVVLGVLWGVFGYLGFFLGYFGVSLGYFGMIFGYFGVILGTVVDFGRPGCFNGVFLVFYGGL